MSTQNTIDKVVSGIPLVVSILVLFSGGVLGTWFLVEENVYYFAYESSESGFLDGKSTYDIIWMKWQFQTRKVNTI